MIAAVNSVERKGNPVDPDILARLAADPTIHDEDRWEFACMLVQAKDPRGNELLADMAVNASDRIRWSAAKALADHGDLRGNDQLVEIARDPHVEYDYRRWSRDSLKWVRDPRFAEIPELINKGHISHN